MSLARKLGALFGQSGGIEPSIGGPNPANSATTNSTGAHTHTVTVDNNTGGGNAHNNTQPTLVLNYIIKA